MSLLGAAENFFANGRAAIQRLRGQGRVQEADRFAREAEAKVTEKLRGLQAQVDSLSRQGLSQTVNGAREIAALNLEIEQNRRGLQEWQRDFTLQTQRGLADVQLDTEERRNRSRSGFYRDNLDHSNDARGVQIGQNIDAHGKVEDINTRNIDLRSGIRDRSFDTQTDSWARGTAQAQAGLVNATLPVLDRAALEGRQSRESVERMLNSYLDKTHAKEQMRLEAADRMTRNTPLDWVATLGGLGASIASLFMA